MIDKYNRTIDYVRISITDKCNLKCVYCLPDGNSDYNPDALTKDDILILVKALANNGIKKVKLTGGEPLIRDDIIEIIFGIKSIPGIEQVTITTNGILLNRYLDSLKEVNIDGINISIDSINKQIFKNITGYDKSEDVINSIFKAKEIGIKNVKVNCVLIKEFNQNEYIEIAKLGKDNDISVRFIEMMPIGLGKNFELFSLDDLLKQLENEFGSIKPYDKKLGNGPASYYTIDGFIGKIGVIGAVSHKFCKDCNRVRITSDGFMKTCLQFNQGENLKKYIDNGNLEEAIKNLILVKQEGHLFDEFTKDDEIFEEKLMSQIGG